MDGENEKANRVSDNQAKHQYISCIQQIPARLRDHATFHFTEYFVINMQFYLIVKGYVNRLLGAWCERMANPRIPLIFSCQCDNFKYSWDVLCMPLYKGINNFV